MQIKVTGKNLDVGDALRQHVETNIEGVVTKYFDHAIDANVTLSRQNHFYRVDISAHIGRGIDIQSHAEGNDPYGALEGALEKLEKRLRRNKRRLRDHHKNRNDMPELAAGAYYVIAAETDEEPADDDNAPEGGHPVVVAEMTTQIATLSVSEAVMRLDLTDAPVLMFRNPVHEGVNVVYRRRDGNIGWIDPQMGDQGVARAASA